MQEQPQIRFGNDDKETDGPAYQPLAARRWVMWARWWRLCHWVKHQVGGEG